MVRLWDGRGEDCVRSTGPTGENLARKLVSEEGGRARRQAVSTCHEDRDNVSRLGGRQGYPVRQAVQRRGRALHRHGARLAFTYGFVEARLRFPAGRGLWPAFWLLPANKSWPPELDPMEAFGATYNAQGGDTQVHIGAISANSADSNTTVG